MKKIVVILTCLSFFREASPYGIVDFFKNALYGYRTITLVDKGQFVIDFSDTHMNKDEISVIGDNEFFASNSDIKDRVDNKQSIRVYNVIPVICSGNLPNNLLDKSTFKPETFHICSKKSMTNNDANSNNTYYYNEYTMTREVIPLAPEYSILKNCILSFEKNRIRRDEYVNNNVQHNKDTATKANTSQALKKVANLQLWGSNDQAGAGYYIYRALKKIQTIEKRPYNWESWVLGSTLAVTGIYFLNRFLRPSTKQIEL